MQMRQKDARDICRVDRDPRHPRRRAPPGIEQQSLVTCHDQRGNSKPLGIEGRATLRAEEDDLEGRPRQSLLSVTAWAR
jgi:hypothetical protein